MNFLQNLYISQKTPKIKKHEKTTNDHFDHFSFFYTFLYTFFNFIFNESYKTQ